ncbi:MAG: hypothetical protein JXP34_18790 [Planctomycetes bacterium]|nr:hypothetical protein [Planctomycetota bacterium]
MVKWAKEYAAAGLIVIGNHVQQATDTELAAFCRSMKVNYTITRGGNVQGVTVRGIPRMVIFDAKGNSVFEGHPADGGVDKQIQELVRESPSYILKGRQLEKLRPLSEALKTGKGYGRVFSTAKGKVDSRDEAEADEAKYVVERIEEHATKSLDRARALESEDPFEAFALYSQIQALYSGAPFSDTAKKRLAELNKDRAFKKEVDAGKIAAKVFEACNDLQPLKPTEPIDLTDEGCFKRNRKAATTILAGYRILLKDHEDSKAFAKVKDLLATYGVKG